MPPTGLHGVCKEDTLNSGSNCRTYYVNPDANYETNIFISSSNRSSSPRQKIIFDMSI